MILFEKILIANRGEIACRIIRTAKKLRIKTVAIFSHADQNALHVQMADEAYLIGDSPSSDSYLHIEKIIAVAQKTNSHAIHPGYGFLSENPNFAKACETAGIIFIGPSSSVIHLMGNKYLAKKIMSEHGIPIVPGYYDQDQSGELLAQEAKKIGFPLVLKAVAGGGGKGLRRVEHENDFIEALNAVKRESKSYFNDDKILIEKYLDDVRHVEVQILGDQYGNVQHLYTRDCSIQRRHQKIIEEAPAPNLPQQLEQQILNAALSAARAIQYTNAGTIEFLVENDQFYFMEMNTRLQVEHPVTESITGIDLVEWQIKIASGEKLFTHTPKQKGHAIEVRLNAEDPDQGYIPSMGKLNYFKLPSENTTLRVDCGYQQDDSITMYYDSLIAKIISHSQTRDEAITVLKNALEQVTLFGIKTNLELLQSILNNAQFKSASINTHFLQQNLSVANEVPELFVVASIFLFFNYKNQETYANIDQDHSSPWNERNGWRLFFPEPISFYFRYKKVIVNASVLQEKSESLMIKINEETYTVMILSIQQEDIYNIHFLLDGKYYLAQLSFVEPDLEIKLEHKHYEIEIIRDRSSVSSNEIKDQLTSPMPGTLVCLLVNKGQKVVKGDKLLVIEAMKMEHTLYAPCDGIVRNCHYKTGDLISEGVELIEFEEQGGSPL